MSAVMERLEAPWTDDQVRSLNNYQRSSPVHPFTCGRCSDQLLVATHEGWDCPVCDYTQNWAWVWMADNSWRSLTVYRTTCHSSPEDFVNERCPRCGTNFYDWLLYGNAPETVYDAVGNDG